MSPLHVPGCGDSSDMLLHLSLVRALVSWPPPVPPPVPPPPPPPGRSSSSKQHRQRRWLGTALPHEVPSHVGGLPNQCFPSFSAALLHSWCRCPNQTCAPDKEEHKSPPLPPSKSPSWTKRNVLEEEGRRRERSLGGGDA